MAIDGAAMAFARALLQPEPETAYSLMTDEAQTNTGRDRFIAQINAMVRNSGSFSAPQIEHTFLVQSLKIEPDTRVICGERANNAWVSLEVKPGPWQAHVLISSATKNNGWSLTLWMAPDGQDWRVRLFHIGISSVVGITPEAMLARAREERDSGHAFNAAMLYTSIRAIIDRGPAFQLGLDQVVRGDMANLRLPPELAGKPPFTWDMQGVVYKVSQVSTIGVEGKLGLTFSLPQTTSVLQRGAGLRQDVPWTDGQAVCRRSWRAGNRSIASHAPNSWAR
jgi:hypothetical protein